MKQEELQKALEAIGKGGIQVAGDLVVEKHVENEIGNVENGGIGIQIMNGKNVSQSEANQPQSIDEQQQEGKSEKDEEKFHFVHPELDEQEGWKIHNAVKRVVKLQGIQMICQYLMQLKDDRKVLLPPNPSAAYTELVRMGMPNGEGFNEITFRKYYNRK